MTRADPRSPLASLANTIGSADDVSLNEVVALAEGLLAQRGAAEGLISGWFQEARLEEPDEATFAGYIMLLQGALEVWRIEASGGARRAREELAAIGALVDRELAGEPVPPELLLVLASAFAEAQVDPGPAMRAALAAGVERAGVGVIASQSDADAHFRDAAGEAGNDPFALFEHLAPTAFSFSSDHRLGMVLAMAHSEVGAAREAVVGFLLDRDADFAGRAAELLARAAPGKPVAAATVERLERIRSWLPAERASGVEAMLAAVRGQELAPTTRPNTEVLSVIASPVDGSGADTLLAVVKRGRRRAMVSLLLKQGLGVVDAVVHEGLTKAEADQMAGYVGVEGGGLRVSPAHFERRLAAALAENVAAAPPPFGLLQGLEASGLGGVAPRAAEPGEILHGLLAGLPSERTDAAALERAYRASASWDAELDAAATWYEAGEEVEAILEPRRTSKQRVAALMDERLPSRRAAWAYRLAWTAAVLREAAPKDPLWIDMALVGRAIDGGAALPAIPLMAEIARRSVEVFEAAA